VRALHIEAEDHLGAPQVERVGIADTQLEIELTAPDTHVPHHHPLELNVRISQRVAQPGAARECGSG
jgi:hypothetical protein